MLFALFISPLADITTPKSNADDNYLFGSGETEKKALENCIKETEIAMKRFLDSGLCVNKKKTEVCVFHQNNSRSNEVVLGSEKVSVLKNMKILGLIFDSKLNWYRQTVTAIEKANKAINKSNKNKNLKLNIIILKVIKLLFVIHHLSLIILHSSLVIRRLSFIVRRSGFVVRRSSFVIVSVLWSTNGIILP